jgi:hypothetical protein
VRNKHYIPALLFTQFSETLGFCESSSALCFVVEAILLHGLKETFLQLLTSLGSDETQKPNPSFWSFILLFLHKQDIKDIQSFTQLTCEVGYSRAFVRKALNESLLSSYLQNIRKSLSTLKKYYNSHAFLLDNEQSETAISLLVGIESYVIFNLPCNSSLLNVWNDAPLQLSGSESTATCIIHPHNLLNNISFQSTQHHSSHFRFLWEKTQQSFWFQLVRTA